MDLLQRGVESGWHFIRNFPNRVRDGITNSMRPKRQLRDTYQMLPRLQLALLIGVVFIGLYSCHYWRSGSFFSILGVGILSAGAFLLVGFLLGFIFAIPRISQAQHRSAAMGPHEPDRSSREPAEDPAKLGVYPNSNLVEISDWLTKILVGVGLVQLNKIPVKVLALVSYLGRGLRDCDSLFCVQSSDAFALGIIISYSSAGFLVGYLWARLYLEKDIENSLAHEVDKAWEYTDMADAAIKTRDWPMASQLLDEALSIDPNHAKAHLKKAYVLKHMAVNDDGTVVDKAGLQEALGHAMEAARLNPRIAGAFYNIACYQALLSMDRTVVLGNLKKAFEKDPKLKKDALEDKDLNSIQEDPQFKTLTS
jgi:hypothetical protein